MRLYGVEGVAPLRELTVEAAAVVAAPAAVDAVEAAAATVEVLAVETAVLTAFWLLAPKAAVAPEVTAAVWLGAATAAA